MLLNLLKLEFMSMFNAFAGGKNAKKKKASLFWAILLTVFLTGYFAVISFSFSTSLTMGGVLIGETELGIVMMFVLTSVISMFYTLTKSSSILFTFKDFDLLFSMPIKASTIIQSKVLFLYFSNFLFKLIIMIPAVLSWTIFTSPSVLQITLVIITIPFINIIPMVIAAIFGFIISYISSFFRRTNLVNMIMSILGVILIMVISFSISLSSNTMGHASAEFANTATQSLEQINSMYPLADLFLKIAKADMLSFAIFNGVSLLAFIGFSAFVGKSFLKVRTRLNSQSVKRKAVEIKEESKSIFGTLLNKELKLLVSIPVYAMNMLTGIIMGLMGIGVLVYFYITQPEIFIDIQDLSFITNPLVPFVLCFFVAYVSTTSCSISLEGNNLWMLKAMPIKAKTFFFSKAIFNILLHSPLAIIGGVVVSFILKSSFDWALVFIILPLTMCVFNTFFSLLLNIRFPMLEWENPGMPVKRSAPVMISVLGNMAIYMGGGLLVLFLVGPNATATMFLVAAVVFNIINAIMIGYISIKAEKILIEL